MHTRFGGVRAAIQISEELVNDYESRLDHYINRCLELTEALEATKTECNQYKLLFELSKKTDNLVL